MPDAANQNSSPNAVPADEDDFDFGSMADLGALMVEAFTMPMATDIITVVDGSDYPTTAATSPN